jgi:signal peptidase I
VTRAAKILGGIAIAMAFALSALLVVPSVLGYQRYVITGASMTGSIDRGSLLFDRMVPAGDLKPGDVITYMPPRGKGPQELVTHRIVSVGQSAGKPVFRTKGDANAAADPWEFTVDQPSQARASFHVPYVGYAYAAFGLRAVRMLLIGLPALLIAALMLRNLWLGAGEELRRRSEKDSPEVAA